jgi:hypothetical protein
VIRAAPIVALLLACCAAPAVAAPLRISGFDAVDDGILDGSNTATALQLLEFPRTGSTAQWCEPVRQNSPTGAHASTANNGGDPTWTSGGGGSQWALQVNVTSGQGPCYWQDTGYAQSQLAAHLRMHQDTAPTGAARALLEMLMTSNVGCVLQENTDQTFSIVLNGTTVGNSVTKALKHVCQYDLQVGCTNPGGTDAACPGVNGGPGPGNCLTCATNSTDGTGCFWPDFELVQTNQGSTIDCDLWVDGREYINGTFQTYAPGVSNITEVRWGALGTEAGANKIWLDDYRTDNSLRAYPGYIPRRVPTASTNPLQWKVGANCSNTQGCLDDYGHGSGTTQAIFISTGTGNNGDTLLGTKDGTASLLWQFGDASGSSVPLVSAPNRVTAVEYVITGKTSTSSGTRNLTENLEVCPTSSTCTPGPAHGPTAITTQNSPELFDWGLSLTSPVPNAAVWTDAAINQLGLQITGATLGGLTTRLGAALYYVSVKTPDAPLPIYLRDHDAGSSCTCAHDSDCADVSGTIGKCKNGKCGFGAGDKVNCRGNSDCTACATGGGCGSNTCTPGDGLRTVMFRGDSTNGGTLSSLCADGVTQCTQPDYCSQDTTGFKDIPTGGCQANNLNCETCTGRTTEAGALAGYQCCDANNGCTDAYCPNNCATNADCGTGGACSAGVCTAGNATNMVFSTACDTSAGFCKATYSGHHANANVPCSSDADCGGLGGTCQSTATCINSCPNSGSCPTRGSWGLDTAGLIGGDVMVNVGLPGVPLFAEATSYLQPGGALQQNSSNAFAAGAFASTVVFVGHGQCSCTTDADCGGTTNSCQGSSGNKRCVLGTANQAQCVGTLGECANGQVCLLPRPDYVYEMLGYNDGNSYQSPDCKGTGALSAFNICTQLYAGAISNLACTTDASCNTALGVSDAECLGAVTGGTFVQSICNATTAGSNCNAYAPACNTDAECTAAGFSTCVNGTSGLAYHTGFCTCGGNANPGPCPSGYACRDSYCRLLCTTDAQCGGSPFTCQSSNGNVCKGRCLTPSDVVTCATDRDCEGTYFNLFANNMATTHGVCRSGHCQCMGVSGCVIEDGLCRDQFRQMNRVPVAEHLLASWRTIFSLAAGETPAGGTPPMIIPMTVPDRAYVCNDTFGRGQDTSTASEMEKVVFPNVVDARVAAGQGNPLTLHVPDGLHFAEGMAQLVGTAVANHANGLNTCVSARGYAGAPVLVCKDNAGTFTNTTCTAANAATVCSSTQTCQPKPCTCSVNTDCTGNHTGTTCVNGVCTGANSCTSNQTICNNEEYYANPLSYFDR